MFVSQHPHSQLFPTHGKKAIRTFSILYANVPQWPVEPNDVTLTRNTVSLVLQRRRLRRDVEFTQE